MGGIPLRVRRDTPAHVQQPAVRSDRGLQAAIDIWHAAGALFPGEVDRAVGAAATQGRPEGAEVIVRQSERVQVIAHVIEHDGSGAVG
jgi:hypothetical protein